ncbi:alkaline phosphatase D family protein [Vibrio mangrovi]|uniref:Alkaline phosphatase D family protein n=1 Tax=Vibrio mangrovi TaxID=474394 RepID=A0A1Y6IX08_9VIBR|nr:alkaline phosphatase D family protein [Vibrio mangrovi]MDW6005376.1 alkaline phosphatase D family protein [Vibrio mangrovi]SMS02184.1 PhoD-like phosphatase [Vibrio mangrovi]
MPALPNPDNFESRQHKLPTAAIVGHVTATSVKIWVRAYRPGEWRLVLSPTPLDFDPFSAVSVNQSIHQNCHLCSEDIQSENGLTTVFEFGDLTPDTTYYYYLIAGGDLFDEIERKVELGSQHQCCFTTDNDEIRDLAFGFYSCHDPFGHKSFSEGLWPVMNDHLVHNDVRFCIGGGDQVYCDTHGEAKQPRDPEGKPYITDLWKWLKTYKNALYQKYLHGGALDERGVVEYLKKLYRSYYRTYWNVPSMLAVFRRYPQYMIWDDHEIMDGWGSLTKEQRIKKLNHLFQDDEDEVNATIARLTFQAAAEVYQEYQHSHNPTTHSAAQVSQNVVQCQWDYAFVKGQVGFYVLDMRGHHDIERAEGERILGREQMSRLQQWLQLPSTQSLKAVFIVSPVPVIHWNDEVLENMSFVVDLFGGGDDVRDEWGHKSNVKERDQLLDLLGRFSAERQVPVTILSGDVHSCSAYKITLGEHPGANLTHVTSSAVSRKPAPAVSNHLIADSGPLYKHANGRCEKLFGLTGENNFLVVRVNTKTTQTKVSVAIYYGAPNDEALNQFIVHVQ